MATTTAQLTLSSGDLTGDALQLSSVATLTGHASNTGLAHTTGVNRVTLGTATREYILVDARDYSSGNKAHKLYIKNLSSSNSQLFEIFCGSQSIGNLYGGDWLFIPFGGAADIKITSSANNMSVEYMVIYEQ